MLVFERRQDWNEVSLGRQQHYPVLEGLATRGSRSSGARSQHSCNLRVISRAARIEREHSDDYCFATDSLQCVAAGPTMLASLLSSPAAALPAQRQYLSGQPVVSAAPRCAAGSMQRQQTCAAASPSTRANGMPRMSRSACSSFGVVTTRVQLKPNCKAVWKPAS